MNLLTKPILKMAKNQWSMVVAKFFNPVGSWYWYLMNLNPEFDPDTTEQNTQNDYAWGIVKGFAVEMGSFSMKELMSIKLTFGLGIERDTSFEPMKAIDVWSQLNDNIHI